MKKTFRIIVLFSLLFLVSCNSNNEIEDANEILNEAKTKVLLPNIVNENIQLPTEILINNKKVLLSWDSSLKSIINNEGHFFIPEYSTEVKLTCTFTYKKENIAKDFYLIAEGNKDFISVFDNIPDYITEETNIQLMQTFNNYQINWINQNNVIDIANNKIVVNKYLQKHQEQTEKIKAEIILPSGNAILLDKNINIAPIKFNDIKAGPIAVYHSVDFTNYYKQYSERYQIDKQLFSDTTKEILDIVY